MLRQLDTTELRHDLRIHISVCAYTRSCTRALTHGPGPGSGPGPALALSPSGATPEVWRLKSPRWARTRASGVTVGDKVVPCQHPSVVAVLALC